MGQKANPISLRLGINRSWDSIWFAKKKEYGKFLIGKPLCIKEIFIKILDFVVYIKHRKKNRRNIFW